MQKKKKKKESIQGLEECKVVFEKLYFFLRYLIVSGEWLQAAQSKPAIQWRKVLMEKW